MVGDVDSNLIRKEDAHLLAMYVQYFHTEEKGMNLIKKFSTASQEFKYEDDPTSNAPIEQNID